MAVVMVTAGTAGVSLAVVVVVVVVVVAGVVADVVADVLAGVVAGVAVDVVVSVVADVVAGMLVGVVVSVEAGAVVGVCVCLLFSIPLPSRTAALSTSPYTTVSCPQPLWVILGQPFLLLPTPPDAVVGVSMSWCKSSRLSSAAMRAMVKACKAA